MTAGEDDGLRNDGGDRYIIPPITPTKTAAATAEIAPAKMFFLQSETILNRIRENLHGWREDGADARRLAAIRGEFSALKNAASDAGFADVAALCGNVESLLGQGARDDSGLLNLLEEAHDGLRADIGFVPTPAREHIRSMNQLFGELLGDSPLADDADFCQIGDYLPRLKAAAGTADLTLIGEKTRAERRVLERIIAPLTDLIRAAASSGFSPQAAARQIRIAAKRSGGELLLEYTADGTGLDTTKLLAEAKTAGLVGEGEAIDEAELLSILVGVGGGDDGGMAAVGGGFATDLGDGFGDGSDTGGSRAEGFGDGSDDGFDAGSNPTDTAGEFGDTNPTATVADASAAEMSAGDMPIGFSDDSGDSADNSSANHSATGFGNRAEIGDDFGGGFGDADTAAVGDGDETADTDAAATHGGGEQIAAACRAVCWAVRDLGGLLAVQSRGGICVRLRVAAALGRGGAVRVLPVAVGRYRFAIPAAAIARVARVSAAEIVTEAGGGMVAQVPISVRAGGDMMTDASAQIAAEGETDARVSSAGNRGTIRRGYCGKSGR